MPTTSCALLIAGADAAHLLSNPRRGIEFTVDRDTVRSPDANTTQVLLRKIRQLTVH
jgi:hypothetical protein